MLSNQTVRIEIGNEVVLATMADWNAKCDELVAKHGGVPNVKIVENDTAPEPTDPVPVAVAVAVAAPAYEGWADENIMGDLGPDGHKLPAIQGGEHDIVGEARSTTDLEAAREAGFAPAQTIYTRGTRVIALGTENARAERLKYDQKPLVSEYCSDLVKKVEAEDRRDFDLPIADIRMNVDGTIMDREGVTSEMTIEERTFPDLVSSLNMPGGFRTALAEVCPEMRATMINMWTADWASDEKAERAEYEEDRVACKLAGGDPDKDVEPATAANLVLRTRVTGGKSRAGNDTRSVFATVTDSYTPFDVDKVARAIQAATPDGARGTAVYDGYRARFEVLFHSDVKPEEYVAGEFFRAGVIVSTDDTGGGSCWGNAVIWQNLCLNLIVIDEANQSLFRIRHVGSVEKMAESFRKGFAEGLAKLDHFVKAWGYASREDLRAMLPTEAKGLPLAEAIPGFFNGILDRELVPVRGKRIEVVKSLTEAWKEDHSSATVHHKGATRAALANAFTRYAHTTNRNVWLQDDIQRAAGALVQSHAKVPYLALPEEE